MRRYAGSSGSSGSSGSNRVGAVSASQEVFRSSGRLLARRRLRCAAGAQGRRRRRFAGFGTSTSSPSLKGASIGTGPASERLAQIDPPPVRTLCPRIARARRRPPCASTIGHAAPLARMGTPRACPPWPRPPPLAWWGRAPNNVAARDRGELAQVVDGARRNHRLAVRTLLPAFPRGRCRSGQPFSVAAVFESLESGACLRSCAPSRSASSFVTCVEFEFCIAYTGCPG